MINKVLMLLGFTALSLILASCGGDDESEKVKPNRNTFLSGVSSSKLTQEKAKKDAKSEEQYVPMTEEEFDNQWSENLKVVDKNVDKTKYKEFMVDPKGPGNAAIRATFEQVGDPIIYVKEVKTGPKNGGKVVNQSFAKIKFKLVLENSSKQDCMKVSLKLYVYDGRNRRMIHREQSMFFQDIKAGQKLTKEIVLEDFRARERKQTKDYAVDFSKSEIVVTSSKFYYN